MCADMTCADDMIYNAVMGCPLIYGGMVAVLGRALRMARALWRINLSQVINLIMEERKTEGVFIHCCECTCMF